MAFMALLAAETGMHPTQYRTWAKSQIGYALGDTGRSFVVGYGVNPPTQPNHRGRLEVIVFHTYIQMYHYQIIILSTLSNPEGLSSSCTLKPLSLFQ